VRRRQPRAPYTTTEVARLAGVSYRQLDYWDRSGVLRPSVRSAKGSGTARRYSDDDLVRCRVIAELLRYGFSLQRVRLLMQDKERFGSVLRTIADEVLVVQRKHLQAVPA